MQCVQNWRRSSLQKKTEKPLRMVVEMRIPSSSVAVAAAAAAFSSLNPADRLPLGRPAEAFLPLPQNVMVNTSLPFSPLLPRDLLVRHAPSGKMEPRLRYAMLLSAKVGQCCVEAAPHPPPASRFSGATCKVTTTARICNHLRGAKLHPCV